MAQFNDFSRSLTAFDPSTTLVVVVEMSEASWLVLGAVPGIERQPLKKIAPDAGVLLALIERWRSEAVRAGRPVSRIVLAYEAGRDGFWLARWLGSRGIEVHVIHARFGIRGFKPHLRKAPERLAKVRTPEGVGLPANTIEEFRRDMARLALVREQIAAIETTRVEHLEQAPDTGPHAMVRLLARVVGIGIETADMLVRVMQGMRPA